uniref:Calmodulin binding transcription activator 1 n=1 Tax=Pseudonaja textilis TaxID=8673 RepID=A0A670ZML9_PSETE
SWFRFRGEYIKTVLMLVSQRKSIIFTFFFFSFPFLDDHGNSNGSHVKIFLPKKLLECLPKCSSLPKERHRWNTNEKRSTALSRC